MITYIFQQLKSIRKIQLTEKKKPLKVNKDKSKKHNEIYNTMFIKSYMYENIIPNLQVYMQNDTYNTIQNISEWKEQR